MNRKQLSMNIGTALAGMVLALAPLTPATAARLGNATVLNAANGVSISVQALNKTMSDGKSVLFWVFCAGGMGGGGGGMGMGSGSGSGSGGGGGCYPSGPTLELGVGQQLNVSLNVMMAPQEDPPYNGHTIHWHGLDVSQSEDGVPETGASVLGDNYKFTVDSRYVGSHMYHCHVHTVKHLEMGMYAPLVVKAVNNAGAFVDTINSGGPAYDYEWNLMYSSVDVAYHSAIDDSPVFADYNPKYFLINGNEGRSKTAPAETVTAAPGKKVAIRLFGVHSVNTSFEIKNASGASQSFTVYNKDGYKLPSTQTLTKLELSPGQTADLMVTLPTATGSWYPQVTFKNLRNGGAYSGGTVYTRLNF